MITKNTIFLKTIVSPIDILFYITINTSHSQLPNVMSESADVYFIGG